MDLSRIAATGASQGGTQPFRLGGINDRIRVAAPVNMISAEIQGGVCENAADVRVGGNNGTSNMVIDALMAPRPLLMISARDGRTRRAARSFRRCGGSTGCLTPKKMWRARISFQVPNYKQKVPGGDGYILWRMFARTEGHIAGEGVYVPAAEGSVSAVWKAAAGGRDFVAGLVYRGSDFRSAAERG